MTVVFCTLLLIMELHIGMNGLLVDFHVNTKSLCAQFQILLIFLHICQQQDEQQAV